MASSALLDETTLRERLAALPEWSIDTGAALGTIVRTARFASWLETLAYVNALGWLCHREDHHPDLQVGYDRVTVRFSTHSAGGLTDRDLALAAGADRLLAAQPDPAHRR